MRWSTWSLIALLGAAACRASDPMPFEEIRSESIYTPALLAGGGASGVVGYGAWDGYGHWPFRLIRHDAAQPDQLVDLGVVDYAVVGYQTPDRLALSETRAAFAVGPQVTVVDFTGPALATTTFQLTTTPETLLADGGWLLSAAGPSLELVDVALPATRFAYTAPAAVTSLLATQGGFLAFTDTGYVRVVPDTVAPAFVPATSMDVRGFLRAFPDGVEAVAAGPSSTIGKVRVVRLDLQTPSSPILMKASEFDGAYGSFAWDGQGTLTLEIQGEVGAGLYQGYVIREGTDAFQGTRVPFPLWWNGDAAHVAAHANRLFLLHQVLSSTEFTFYRIL